MVDKIMPVTPGQAAVLLKEKVNQDLGSKKKKLRAKKKDEVKHQPQEGEVDYYG